MYTLTIGTGGSVEFEGIAFVATCGRATAQASLEAVDEITDFQPIELFFPKRSAIQQRMRARGARRRARRC